MAFVELRKAYSAPLETNTIPQGGNTTINTQHDNVNQPVHYTFGGIECVDAIKAQMPREAFLGFLQGNVVKYLWRWRDKAGVESLKKGQWYLNHLIKELENG